MFNSHSKEEIQRCHEIANTIFGQLFWSIDKPTYWSWGVSKTNYTFYKNMPSLMLKVSGAIHKGYVLVSLDEGSDTYIITLLDNKKEVVASYNDIYCDSVGSKIDELIERPAGMTDKEYKEAAIKDSIEKMNQ